MNKSMNVFVTGGLGFIGSHIVEYHLRKNDSVLVVDNLSSGNEKNVDLFKEYPNYQFEKGDLIDWKNLNKAVNWADRIYHMAAVVGVLRVIQEPVNVITSNIAATEKLFTEISRSDHRPRVMIASSSGVYGNGNLVMSEEDDLIVETPQHEHSNYSISKLSDEIIGLSYNRIKNIPTTVIRFFNTIGPRQTGSYGFVVPRFVQQACKHEPLSVYGDGSQSRSFCDVRDVVNILQLLSENENAVGQVVNIGNDREVTIKKLADIVIERAKSQSEIRFVPYQEIYGSGFIDIMHRRPDLKKMFDLADYRFEWTLESTIDDLIKRFKKQ